MLNFLSYCAALISFWLTDVGPLFGHGECVVLVVVIAVVFLMVDIFGERIVLR